MCIDELPKKIGQTSKLQSVQLKSLIFRPTVFFNSIFSKNYLEFLHIKTQSNFDLSVTFRRKSLFLIPTQFCWFTKRHKDSPAHIRRILQKPLRIPRNLEHGNSKSRYILSHYITSLSPKKSVKVTGNLGSILD